MVFTVLEVSRQAIAYFLVTMVIHHSSVWRRRGGSCRGGSGGEWSCMDGEWRGKGRRVMEVR